MFKSNFQKKSMCLTLLGGVIISPVQSKPISFSEISAKFQETTPFKVYDVKQSEVDGLVLIETEKGVFYSTEDGKFLISGSLHQFEPGLDNLTKVQEAEIARKKIAELNASGSLITYTAKEQRAEVLVFYDVSCGYCRKLHAEIAQYNALGITVHYAMYPRNGLSDTQSVDTMKSILCADNPKINLNNYNSGNELAIVDCSPRAIEQSRKLGDFLKVTGTPAIYDMNGYLVSRGYMNANNLAQLINIRALSKKQG